MIIKIVDFKTNYKTRRQLIDSSDLIIYVCCTGNEIKKLSEPMKIGQNDFHDDYNRIHFYDKYQKKCLNITFNKQVNEIDYFLTKSEKSLENNLLSARLAFKSNSGESVSSSLFSNIQPNGNSFYLKLPNQNEEFVSYILENSDIESNQKYLQFNESIESDSTSSIKTIRSRLNVLPFKILVYNINKTLTKLIDNELKKGKQLINFNQNINFNDQPNEEESLFEESDDDCSSQEIDSQFSTIKDEHLSLLNEPNNIHKKFFY